MTSHTKSALTLRSDFFLCLIILAHAAATYAMSLYVGGTQWFNVKESTLGYAYVAIFLSTICLVYALLKGIITRNLVSVLKDFINLRLLRGVVVFIFIGLLLGAFHSFKIMMPEFVPFTWDPVFADIDQAIHFDDPWRYLTALDTYYEKIAYAYTSGWILLHVMLTLFISISDIKIRSQYLYTFVTSWIICGNILPLLFMAVGPIYYERLTGNPRFSELSDRIFGAANENYPHTLIADTLWQSFINKNPFIGSGISAFPSMHVAISMLIFLTTCKFGKGLGALGFSFLIFTLIGSVNLGWHYAIDGYASIILVLLIWTFWGRVFKADNTCTTKHT